MTDIIDHPEDEPTDEDGDLSDAGDEPGELPEPKDDEVEE